MSYIVLAVTGAWHAKKLPWGVNLHPGEEGLEGLLLSLNVCNNGFTFSEFVGRKCLHTEANHGVGRAWPGARRAGRCVAASSSTYASWPAWRHTVNPLYRPHGRRGERSGGPSTVVRPDTLMMVKLHAWLSVIEQCAGAQFTIVFVKGACDTMRAAAQLFAATSDAAGDGRGTPGMGGYCHGFYWRVPLPAPVLELMHITAWETLVPSSSATV